MLFSQGGVVARGGAASNNVGEYGGLLAFLEWFVPTGMTEAAVYSDSQLLINQMTGEWRVRGGLYVSRYSKAVNLIRENKLRLTFCWIPREQNEEADKLSKDALAAAGVQLRIQP